MDKDTIINQLKKALEKDDAELRLRVEVLVDMMKDYTYNPRPFIPASQPLSPIPPATVYDAPPSKQPYKITGKSSNKVAGSGSIVSANSEQINYTRPEGT